MLKNYLDIKPEVAKALKEGKASSSFRIYYYISWNAISKEC